MTKKADQTTSRAPLTIGNQHGSVLLICLVVLLMLSAFGMIALHTTDAELQATSQRKASITTFFSAESGLAEAMRRLREQPSSPDYLGDTSAPYDPDWSAYLLTDSSWDSSDDPQYDDSLSNYIPTAIDSTNTTVQANSKQGEIGYYVRIRHKREYDAEVAGHTPGYPHYVDNDIISLPNSDGARGGIVYYGYGDSANPTKAVQFSPSSATEHHPVEIVTAYGRLGDTSRVIEAEIARNPGIKVLSAIYSEGNFTGNGNAATISGTDQCGAVDDIPAIYNLDPATTSVMGGTIAGAVDHGSNDLDLASYIDSLKSASMPLMSLSEDVNGGTYGTAGSPVSVYSETSGNVGGLKMSNVTGYGNLIIEGDLEMGGGFTWNGLVVVTGTVKFNGGGSGVNIAGAVMAEDTVSVNGGLEIYYNSCAIDDAVSVLGYKVINWRQL